MALGLQPATRWSAARNSNAMLEAKYNVSVTSPNEIHSTISRSSYGGCPGWLTRTFMALFVVGRVSCAGARAPPTHQQPTGAGRTEAVSSGNNSICTLIANGSGGSSSAVESRNRATSRRQYSK